MSVEEHSANDSLAAPNDGEPLVPPSDAMADDDAQVGAPMEQGSTEDSGTSDQDASAAEIADSENAGGRGPVEVDLHEEEEDLTRNWYILKVQVNREDSIRDALQRRVKIEGRDRFFGDIVVPTEDVAEFTKSGKRRVVKKKLYPGYIMVNMAINDDTWFLVRETPGIGDFTGSAGRPTPMDPPDVERILKTGAEEDEDESPIKTSIPFEPGDRVRVKEGNFESFEGDVESIDAAKGHVTVLFSIFGRPTPVELPHWQIEKL